MTEIYRYETKFLLSQAELPRFLRWVWSGSTFRKHYPRRVNNTLYFDDLEFGAVRDNLIGVANREKHRLRWYGETFVSDHSLRFESKTRNGRVGTKKVSKISLDCETRKTLTIEALSELVNKGPIKNANHIYKKYLSPTLFVSYDRIYFISNANIRLTIDSDMKFAYPYRHKKIKDLQVHKSKNVIIEFKYNIEDKDKVTNLIRSMDLTPTRNSKYLTGLAMLKLVNYI